jgi:quercetin dioxygenase-like cupin family protein
MQEPVSVPRPEWSPVPHPGCVNVVGKVLLQRDGLTLAVLKFDAEGTSHEHAAPFEIDVICLEGEGYISIEDRIWTFRSGLSLHAYTTEGEIDRCLEAIEDIASA